MKIGITLPTIGRLARQPREIARFARQAEDLGAASLWVADRLLAPTDPTVGYGGGTAIPDDFRAVLDPFTVLAVAATSTDHALLGSNVLLAPWYAPALLARSLTTLDLVSGGRLLAGFGVGWSPEEYQAAGVPMAQRGARLDECLDALAAWWSDNPVEYRGTHTTIPRTYVDLKPVRPGGPPIYLGGYSDAALRRVARRANGWIPVTRPGAVEFDPERLTAQLTHIRTLAAEHGRDPDTIDAILRVYPTEAASVDDLVSTIDRAGHDAGIDHVIVDLMTMASTVDEALGIIDPVLRRTSQAQVE
jgi:probable F420-dependent oxidoreductase